jgi:hypothetical protein
LKADSRTIIGELTQNCEFDLERTQSSAWSEQIEILRSALGTYSEGSLFFEYSIPRLGRRIDVVLILDSTLFVLEFKVGESEYPSNGYDQVWDYALDLKNFHEASHKVRIAPILICTEAPADIQAIAADSDNVIAPLHANKSNLAKVIADVQARSTGPTIDPKRWEESRYHPTPTIIEAATALYAGHAVSEISRSDAGAINLSQTSDAISQVIVDARKRRRKAICFLTGVPGAGKTLVGLNIATQHMDSKSELYSVFLSGNGPLVAILREALTRDRVAREKANLRKLTKGDAMREVSAFIQNVHHFRRDGLTSNRAPIEHVALFDEAQRAWNLEQTSNFMRRKQNTPDFKMSEPEFLISCMDRHSDWAVVVCLVGGGQEINTGESGISEWIDSLNRSYKDWDIHVSPHLKDSEYGAGAALAELKGRTNVSFNTSLHLSTSMRSFRAERVSHLVKQLLDLQSDEAQATWAQVKARYPIALTRDLNKAKNWVRQKARGSDRYGLIASSQAQRLKPHAIDVRAKPDPVHWFLDDKDDTRSSYYLEDAATEFDVQGLEVDWACVTWDADFRFSNDGWQHMSFVGDRWNNIRKPERQLFQKNAYRVLLTRARQGMVIFVPEGAPEDPTRKSDFYDPTFSYLRKIGFQVL